MIDLLELLLRICLLGINLFCLPSFVKINRCKKTRNYKRHGSLDDHLGIPSQGHKYIALTEINGSRDHIFFHKMAIRD